MIIGVQISPDSEHVVAGASDGWIYIWKVRILMRLLSHAVCTALVMGKIVIVVHLTRGGGGRFHI